MSRKTRSRRQKSLRQRQRGGGCTALSQGNSLVARRQVGGWAPYGSPDLLLVSAQAREQAQVGGLDQAIRELPSVIRQSGGRRKSRKSRKSRKQRGGMQDFNTAFQAGGRRRRQRGGMAPFDTAFTYAPNYAGQNPQWLSVSQGGAQASGQSSYL